MPLQDVSNSPAKQGNTRRKSVFSVFGRKKSKELAVDAVTTTVDQDTTLVKPEPCFFSVIHEFNPGKAAEFWEMIGSFSPADWEAMAKKHHDLGFHNHTFLPSSPTGLVNCVWEAKDSTAVEDFQAFIDGPDGPGPGIFTNKVYKVMPGAVLPSSFWHEAVPKPTMQTSGSFFWVYHEFHEGAAAGFWEMMGSMTPDGMAQMNAKNRSLGFENHSFQPLDPAGPCICIWESKEPLAAEEFQAFIDGPEGPGAGAVFRNQVFKVMPGAVLPPAKFPQPSVVQHRINTIPIKPGSMASILAIAESDDFQMQMESFEGLLSVEMLEIDQSTMCTHSRWQSEAYVSTAAAAFSKALGSMKEHLAGPPMPEIGTVAWHFSGRAVALEGIEPVVRLTTMVLKPGGLEAMLEFLPTKEGTFAALGGLISVDMIKVDNKRLVCAAKYHSKPTLDEATPVIGATLKEVAHHFTAPPAASIAQRVWSFPKASAISMTICQPTDGSAPDKVLGPTGRQAKMWMTKLPDGRQAARIAIDQGFSWTETIKPILPGCPDWCPATHFGYLESGTMGVLLKDGTERTVRAGETYFIPPGHLPVLSQGPAVMVEFSQDTTYTKDIKK